MYRVFVVEDDKVIAKTVTEFLRQWGCTAESAENFSDVMSEFAAFAPQLVLLDISLPFFNGYHWCNEIRKVSKVPIVFISSASDSMNIVMAMNMGADDFISKPFDLNVLNAKVQAILRRTYEFAEQTELIEQGGAILNVSDGTLYYNEEKIELTRNEYKIMRLLMENRGRTVSRDEIMTYLWETDSFIDDNTLTVNIARLRKKLEAAGIDDFIKTKKGMGYLV